MKSMASDTPRASGIRSRSSPALARWMRMKRDGNAMMLIDGEEHDFVPGSVLQILELDISQEIYGLPGDIGAMQSAVLTATPRMSIASAMP